VEEPEALAERAVEAEAAVTGASDDSVPYGWEANPARACRFRCAATSSTTRVAACATHSL